jgi:hypothetical protein
MSPWIRFSRNLIAAASLLIGLVAATAGRVEAAVPSPVNSQCPTFAAVAPNGSCCFDVIVRDVINNPVPGSSVVVDFGACPVTFCPAQPPGLVVVGNTVTATADAAGKATFCICATVTLPCNVTIYADGIQLCTVPVAAGCGPTPNRPSAWGRLKVLYR